MNYQEPLTGLLERIARALERLSPSRERHADFGAAEAFVWHAEPQGFAAVREVNRVPLSLLKGVEAQRDTLAANTRQFARGLPANNALLWGARGMGKSSLVKAVHAEISRSEKPLRLIEIHREDIGTLPQCLTPLRGSAPLPGIL
jgi:predicted AAA+ superfamily ATPase